MAEIKGVKVYINLYDKWGNSVGAIELEPRLVDGLPKSGSRKGELVLNTQDSKLYFWDGSTWKKFAIDPHAHVRADITDFFDSPFWDNIPDKPSEFPPEAHTHPRSDITDFFDSPFWDNIPDKPDKFPPEAHTHSVSDITFDGSVTPDADNSYDLGSETSRWRNGYFAGTIYSGNVIMSGKVGWMYLEDVPVGAIGSSLLTNRILRILPDSVEYYDENTGEWVAWDVDVSPLVDGRYDRVLTIDSAHKKFRLTWSGLSWVGVPKLLVVYPWSTPDGFNKDHTVIVESSSDGTAWTNRGTFTLKAGMYVNIFGLQHWASDSYVRITFDLDLEEGETYKISEIKLLHPRTDQNSGNQNDILLDINKRFEQSIIPSTDNSYDLGSSSLRWRSIYVVNTYTGDVVFQNGWKITEFDENGKLMDGLRVLNKDGVEILRITEDGLYFKGKKIA